MLDIVSCFADPDMAHAFLLTTLAFAALPSSSSAATCASCKVVVHTFNEGMKKTARGKLGGGDTAWEEKNQLLGYTNSEVRFVEIQEQMCRGVANEAECHAHHNEWEDLLEEWWRVPEWPDLYHWLCIDKLKLCCPENHFGPHCEPCHVLDDFGNYCSGHGKCKGAGTRTGNGRCLCHDGYTGTLCDECDEGYFEKMEEDRLTCSTCQNGCDICTGPNIQDCTACRKGYGWNVNEGCVDVDECASGDNDCKRSEFCVNRDGDFMCGKCHRACDGCLGSGPAKCKACSRSYVKSGDFCVAWDKLNVLERNKWAVYAALVLISCALLKLYSAAMAALFLFVVAVGMSLSGSVNTILP